MKLSEHKDLKKEILALPPKEKDKLLLRLVAKDKVLTEHLHFLLLEDENDLKYRAEQIKGAVVNAMDELKAQRKLNAKEVLTSLRKLTKLVNHFYKVTKAPFEEVELKIYLFNTTVIDFKSKAHSYSQDYEYIFANYFVKSVAMVLKKFYKLHEDLQFDLKEDVNVLLNHIHQSYLKSNAVDLQLPIQV
jgi:hypothetical protein